MSTFVFTELNINFAVDMIHLTAQFWLVNYNIIPQI